LGDELSLILAVPQGFRGEFGGTEIEIRARQFRVLSYRLTRTDRRITDHLRRRSALLEEFALNRRLQFAPRIRNGRVTGEPNRIGRWGN
jgi:hypothetical protein